jgi:hypothetical protein
MDNWTRKQMNPGTEFRSADGRVVVKQAVWPKPGFRNIASRGWVVLVNGEQYGAAHRNATDAMRWAEMPGPALAIAKLLG